MLCQLQAARQKSNGYFKFVGYIYGTPGHLRIVGVEGDPIHIEEHLQAKPIKMFSDQILRLSINFVSVSARISS